MANRDSGSWRRGAWIGLLLSTGALLGRPWDAAAQLIPEDTPIPLWGTNGEVRALARVGDLLFVGGTFDVVGPPTGGLAIADAADAGVVTTTDDIPNVNLVASDGAGGWYAAQMSDAEAGPTIAHVGADGTPTPGWTAPVFGWGPTLFGLAVGAGRVFVTGDFQFVNGVAHPSIVALDAATGAVLPWAPALRSGRPVGGVPRTAVDQGRVYLSLVDGPGNTAAPDVIAVDALTGALLPFAVAPLPHSSPYDIVAAADGRVILAGRGCGGDAERISVCAFDTQGQRLWVWDPPAGRNTDKLWAAGPRIYAFVRDPGLLVALEAQSGERLPWTLPEPIFVNDVADDGTRVFVAGSFAGRPDVTTIAALDHTSGAVTSWDPMVGATVLTVATSGGRVAMGGKFTVAGGARRRHLVAFDLRTGALAAPTPQPSGPVNVLAVYGDFVFVAAGPPGPEVFAFSAATGERLPWGLVPNGSPLSLAVARQRLYIGGHFSQLSGQDRSFLAAVDLTNGALLPWNPPLTFEVAELTIGGDRLYAAGRVAGNGPVVIKAMGFMLDSGEPLPFDPVLEPWNLSGRYLVAAGGRVLSFRRWYQPPSVGISWLHPDTGHVQADMATAFLPTIGEGVGDTVILGGLSGLGSYPAVLTAMRVQTGQFLPWSVSAFPRPLADGPVFGVVLGQQDLVAVGGTFARIAGRQAANVAVFRARRPGAPQSLAHQVDDHLVTLSWQPGDAPAATGYFVEAGSTPGGAQVGRFAVGGATRVSGHLPNGRYYVRVLGLGDAGTGAPSNEVVIDVPALPVVPDPPSGLTAQRAGNVVTLQWTAAGGNPQTYVIDAGTASGLTNLLSQPTGSLDTTLVTPAPPGTYYVRVRASNRYGASTPSNEIVVIVP